MQETSGTTLRSVLTIYGGEHYAHDDLCPLNKRGGMYGPVVVGFMWKYPSLRQMANPVVRVCELSKKNTPSDEIKYIGLCESVICKYSTILCK